MIENLKKNEIRVGVIGAGYIAQQNHIPAYLTNPRARLVGVADPDETKLEEVKTASEAKDAKIAELAGQLDDTSTRQSATVDDIYFGK